MARRHLAIFLKGVAEKILTGEKQVEIRLSQSKVIPYLTVTKDDIIILKISGGKIIGQATADNVLYYDHINRELLSKIKKQYAKATKMNEEFWKMKRKSRYATIILLKNPIKYLSPVVYQKHDRRPWVIMEDS